LDEQPIKLLVIEDNAGDVRLLQEMLREPGLAGFEMVSAGTLADGLARLAEGGIDLLLLDLGLPDSQGLDTVNRAHAAASTLPIIVLTGLADEQTGVAAIQAGAQDYLVKGQVDVTLLVKTMRYAMQRKQAEEALSARERQQGAVADLGRQALGGMDLDQLFEHAVALVAQTLSVEYCGVLEFMPEARVLLLRAGSGWKPGVVGRATVSPMLDSQAGFTLLSDEPVIVEDTSREDRFNISPVLTDHGVVSGITAVIPGEDMASPFGVLGAHTTRHRTFTWDDINFLRSVANVLATAIQRKRSEEEIQRLATTDALTGIANRRKFYEILDKELSRAQRYGTPFSLIMYDLDHFKQVNDAHGHAVGDEVLKGGVDIVRRNIRAADILARWGGEEFMILTPETAVRAAENMAEKLRAEFEAHRFATAGTVTASFGVTQFETSDDVLSLTKKVDEALYRAKAHGRNRVEVVVYREEKRINILLLEDNPGDVRLIREMLKEVGMERFSMEPVDCLAAALERLGQDGIDVVLMDLGLPDSQGLDTLSRVRVRAPAQPIVVLTGIANPEVGISAIQQGAQDYLVKGQVDSSALVRTLRYAIERKKTEEQIKASLREKEVLLAEIHHRVKNNLQIVSSLLRLQARAVKDPKYAGMLNDSESRVRTMALVHEKLYMSENLASVDLKGYLRSLAEELLRYYKESAGDVALKLDVGDVSFGLDTIIPCGLIVSELVTNSLKHAFPDRRGGEIEIAVKAVDDEYELRVRDNGVGIPPELDIRKTETLGLQLVTSLAEMQLKGHLELDRSHGTEFRIRFRERE
jgi:diguanylate cyclase (GGDEF)-like protein